MNLRKKRAFTLVEILVAVSLFALMLGALYTAFVGGNATWQTYSGKATAQKDARGALFAMTKELREASNISVTQDANTATINFTNGDGNAASYSWNKTGTNAKRIIYQDTIKTRIIATDISALSFTNDSASVTITITSTKQMPRGQTGTFNLKEKIALR